MAETNHQVVVSLLAETNPLVEMNHQAENLLVEMNLPEAMNHPEEKPLVVTNHPAARNPQVAEKQFKQNGQLIKYD